MHTRSRTAVGTLLGEMVHDLFAGDESHTSVLQIVVPASKQPSKLSKLVEVPSKRVTDQLLPFAPRFAGELVEFGLEIRRELNFHGPRLGNGGARVKAGIRTASFSFSFRYAWHRSVMRSPILVRIQIRCANERLCNGPKLSPDAPCLTPVQQLPASSIQRIRTWSAVSHAAFAAHLNVTTGLVSNWKRGEKHPSGPAARRLALAGRHGISAIA